MTILTPEAMALLKRMDAEEALQKAVDLALDSAWKAAHNRLQGCTVSKYATTYECKAARDMATQIALDILALKAKK